MGVGTARTKGPTAWAIEPGALRRVAPVLVSGAAAGLAGGIGARLAMRVSAVAAPDAVQGALTEAQARIGEITLGGSVFLVLFAGIASALAGSAFYLAVRAWLPTHRFARATAFGLLELLAFGTVVLDPGNPDFTIVGHPALNLLLFGSLFVLHGALLVLWQRPARALIEAIIAGPAWRARIVDAATILGSGLMLLSAALLGLRGGVGWTATPILLVLACAAGLATIDPSRARRVTRPALWATGAIALAVIGVSGAVELVDAAATIL
jgi:hypothetical protein